MVLDEKIIDGKLFFKHHTGAHLIKEIQKNNSIEREKAILLLLEKEILNRHICNDGYEIIRESTSEHMDSTVYVKCK